jgi:hypothetical protein
VNPLTYQPVSTPRGKGIAITTTVLAVLCAGINVLAAASVVLMHLFLELLDAVQNWDSLKPDAEQQHSTSAWFVAAAAVLIVAAVEDIRSGHRGGERGDLRRRADRHPTGLGHRNDLEHRTADRRRVRITARHQALV